MSGIKVIRAGSVNDCVLHYCEHVKMQLIIMSRVFYVTSFLKKYLIIYLTAPGS